MKDAFDLVVIGAGTGGISVARACRKAGWRVGEEHAAYKTIIARDTGKILGAHVLGPGAEEQLDLFSPAMKSGVTANDLKATIFAYPDCASDIGYMV